MKDRFNCDGVLKDLFQADGPAILNDLTGGIPVIEFLNVELPKVLERRLDLAMRLADGSILHIELQAKNDPAIAYREGVYCFLLGQKYPGCRIRQVVLYVGPARMRMAAGIDLGETQGAYRLMDIREIDAAAMLASGRPVDTVLAVLAGGGDRHIGDIVARLAKSREPGRDRAIAQLMILSGLRGLPGRLEWELKRMSVVIDIRKNPVLMRWQREAIEQGRAEGLNEGRTEGRTEGLMAGRMKALAEILRVRFGPLPKWASERLTGATAVQLSRWTRKSILASSLEGVLGKK